MKISVQKLWGLANPTKKPGNLYPQSLNNISLIKGRPTGMCSTKSLNTQDMLSSTPVLTSCIGVIKRWEPLPQAKKQSDGWPYNIIGDQHHKGSSSAQLLYKNHPCDKHTYSALLTKIVQVQLQNVEIAGHLGQQYCIVSCYLPCYKRHKKLIR